MAPRGAARLIDPRCADRLYAATWQRHRSTVELLREHGGVTTSLAAPAGFDVVPLRTGALAAAPPAEVAAFWRRYEDAVRPHSAVQVQVARLLTGIDRMAAVLEQAPAVVGEVDADVRELREVLRDLDQRLLGSRSRKESGEKVAPTAGSRLEAVGRGVGWSTCGATPTQRHQLELAERELAAVRDEVAAAQEQLSALARRLVAAGAPWLEGEPLPGRGN